MSNKLLSTVICSNVLIRKAGQRVYFQIKIPRDVIRIKGIETSIRSRYCRAFTPWRRDFTAGLLTLQAPDSTAICYSSYVEVEQSILLPTDLGYTTFTAGFKYGWETTWNTVAQSAAKEPDILDMPAPAFLNGMYVDQWGATMNKNLTYRLSIHLWVTVNDLYNVPCNE